MGNPLLSGYVHITVPLFFKERPVNRRLVTVSRTPADKLLFEWAGNFENRSAEDRLRLLDRMKAAIEKEREMLLEDREWLNSPPVGRELI